MPMTKLTPLEFCANVVHRYAKRTIEYRFSPVNDTNTLRFSSAGIARMSAICAYITAMDEFGDRALAAALADDLVKWLDYLNKYGCHEDDKESSYIIELHDDGTKHGFSVMWYRMVPYNDDPDCCGTPDDSMYRYYFNICDDWRDIEDFDGDIWVVETCDNCDAVTKEETRSRYAFNVCDEAFAYDDCDGDATEFIDMIVADSSDADKPGRYDHQRPDLDRAEWWRKQKTKAVFAFNGGLLYHGPGAGQTYSVSLNSSLWSIHT